jgi:adenylate cyclase class IV
MRNIELKARVPSLDQAETAAIALGAQRHMHLTQIDTYFQVPSGRLKLRECIGDQEFAELIFYRRLNELGPKRCLYDIAPVTAPEATKKLLTNAFELLCVVRKRRTVYLFENVRVHLDRVEGLGNFIEFEAVMEEGKGDNEGNSIILKLMEGLGVKEDALVNVSYSDMVKRISTRHNGP